VCVCVCVCVCACVCVCVWTGEEEVKRGGLIRYCNRERGTEKLRLQTSILRKSGSTVLATPETSTAYARN
jgi:hypothetical protein